jgi:hypothetical protein
MPQQAGQPNSSMQGKKRQTDRRNFRDLESRASRPLRISSGPSLADYRVMGSALIATGPR